MNQTRSKYGVRTDEKGKLDRTADGILFASKKECRRYLELRLLERADEIEGLELQPSYELKVNGHKICTYRADFKYMQYTKPKASRPPGDYSRYEVVEDVKGLKTPVYQVKKKLMLACHGIEVQEEWRSTGRIYQTLLRNGVIEECGARRRNQGSLTAEYRLAASHSTASRS